MTAEMGTALPFGLRVVGPPPAPGAGEIVGVVVARNEALRLGDQIILLQEGGHVAQRGTGAELLGAPASAFVADFMGLDRGQRTLYDKDGVLVDGFGRAAGVLAEDAPA